MSSERRNVVGGGFVERRRQLTLCLASPPYELSLRAWCSLNRQFMVMMRMSEKLCAIGSSRSRKSSARRLIDAMSVDNGRSAVDSIAYEKTKRKSAVSSR